MTKATVIEHKLTRKDMRHYPYMAEDSTTRGACCDSTIGPTCEHVTEIARKGTDNA